ncbi:MAG: hypothetical protein ACREB3_16870, partial [Burkholderiales bacterium]
MPQNQGQSDNVDTQFLDRRTRQQNAEVDRLVQQRLAQPDPDKPAPVQQTLSQAIDEIPSTAFRGSFGVDTGLLPFKVGKEPTTTFSEATVGQGMLSGIEKEAADTLSSIPNIALIAGTGGLGTIPAIAKVGGTRLLSAFFGLEMGKALWERYKEYYKTVQEEGGLGPRSRELLGRMTVLAGFTIKAGEHALTGQGTGFARTSKPAPGEGTPLAEVKKPGLVPNENVEAVLEAQKPKTTAEPSAGQATPAQGKPEAPSSQAAPPTVGEARVNLARID